MHSCWLVWRVVAAPVDCRGLLLTVSLLEKLPDVEDAKFSSSRFIRR